MPLEKFKMWTVEALWTYLSLRNKGEEEVFETIVYRLALFFISACVFWSTWNRSIKILLMPFIYEGVASAVQVIHYKRVYLRDNRLLTLRGSKLDCKCFIYFYLMDSDLANQQSLITFLWSHTDLGWLITAEFFNKLFKA